MVTQMEASSRSRGIISPLGRGLVLSLMGTVTRKPDKKNRFSSFHGRGSGTTAVDSEVL
jgi:hypothetical protein